MSGKCLKLESKILDKKSLYSMFPRRHRKSITRYCELNIKTVKILKLVKTKIWKLLVKSIVMPVGNWGKKIFEKMCNRENIYNPQNKKQISFVLNTESFTIAAGFVCCY